MRKKKPPLTPTERLLKLKNAVLDKAPSPNRCLDDCGELLSIEQRVKMLFELINTKQKMLNSVLFFVMYDIESNKVRNQVVKYLQRMGCHRIQKSIFLADLSAEKYQQIRTDLAEIQALYDNQDSIIVCPVSTELLRSMKVIGQNINIDVIMHTQNTLFF